MNKVFFLVIFFWFFLAISSNSQGNTSLVNEVFFSVGGGISKPTTKIGHYIITSITNEHDDIGSYYYQKLKKNSVITASIGKKFNKIRTEFEYINLGKKKYSQGNFLDIDGYKFNFNIKSKVYLFNIAYNFDFFVKQKLIPYINISVGMAENHASKSNLFSTNNVSIMYYEGKVIRNFAKGVGAGFLLDLNSRFSIDFSYKYLDLGKIKGSKICNIFSSQIQDNNNNLRGTLKSNLFYTKLIFKF